MKRKPSTEATAAWIRLMRIQSRVLDAVEQELKKAGFPPLAWYDALLELSRAPIRRNAPGRTGKADADPAILDLAADRPAGRRGIGGAARMQDRQARPVRRDHRGRARTAEEDVAAPIRPRSKNMSARNCPMPTPSSCAACLTGWAARATRRRRCAARDGVPSDDIILPSRISGPDGPGRPLPHGAFGRSASIRNFYGA